MNISIQATQGLNAIGLIAASSRLGPMPTTRLARQLGLCLSSTEIVVKRLKNGGLLRSHRGPGGGYQLERDVSQISAWDVISCFEGTKPPAANDHKSSESDAALGLAMQLDQRVREYLQIYPLTDVMQHLRAPEIDSQQNERKNVGFRLKPLQRFGPPVAPSWVFDLAKFMRTAHA